MRRRAFDASGNEAERRQLAIWNHHQECRTAAKFAREVREEAAVLRRESGQNGGAGDAAGDLYEDVYERALQNVLRRWKGEGWATN